MNDSTKTKKSLPEAGQWPDKLFVPALVASAFCILFGIFLVFFYASPVNGASVDGFEMVGGELFSQKILLSQKIFYFHMPAALISFLMLTVAALYSIRYLTTREQRFDTCACCAMEIALIFVICTMISGDAWTRFEWGVWWTWDPRLTTYLILMLIVIAYFVMRSAIDQVERRSVYSAVISIITFVDVPICFMVTRLIPSSIHPVVVREGGMAPDMVLTLVVCLIGLFLFSFVLYRLRFRQVRVAQRTEFLKEKIDSYEDIVLR